MASSGASATPKAAAKSSKGVLSKITWYELLVIPVVALGVAIYWFKDEIAHAVRSTAEGVTLWLGIGIVPLAVWLGALTAVLAFNRSLFRHWRLWLASIPMVALAFGVLSLFKPFDGALAWFTLNGYVSLGGRVGETIAGASLLQRALSLGGLAAIAIIIASPAFALLFAAALGKSVMYLCVGVGMACRAIAGLFRRKPPDEQEQDAVKDPTPAYEDASGADIEGQAASQDALSAASYNIDSTMGSSVKDESPYERYARETAGPLPSVTALYEPEDTDMQANTDFDFGYSRAANETALADADTDDYGALGQEHTNGYDYNGHNGLNGLNGFVDLDAAVEDGIPDEEPIGELQEIEDLMDAQQPELPAEETAPAGIAVRFLGKNRAEWDKPSIQMLESVQDRGVPEDQIRDTAETIRQTLADYGIEVEIGNIKYGPTVTMYGIIPGWVRRYKQVKLEDEFGNPILDEKGKQITKRQEQKTRVKVGSILSREQDLSLALRTPNLRIETPVMGKAQVGIEIPNQEPAPVTLRSIMESAEYQNLRKDADLPVAMGKGTGGENIALDLATMPHLLIAGATGSGKSVALNAIVAGLLMEKSPAEMRLLLVDPKRVELTPYNGIPHLLCPVIVEVDEVVGMLKGVINEMMNRYRRMEEIGVRNIEAYNKRMRDDKMPFLMVVVDELADLMMTAAFDVEQSLCRLAQLGRATGIHLILATQRPSVDVVTGLIKANFPSRVSFGVTSHIDSRTILDTNGAEKLLGKGDMLYLPRDAARPIRAQGAFISDTEIDKLIDFWQTTPRAWLPDVDLRPVSDEGEEEGGSAPASTDALFDKAVELAQTQKKLSTSLLQRRLRIGYPRAARLMDELEENGIVSASDGAKSRDVIISA